MRVRRAALGLAWLTGWGAGWVLAWRLPALTASSSSPAPDGEVAVVVPARDEEHNLAGLLADLAAQSEPPAEVVVVDDGSADRTADVAAEGGAAVVPAGDPPPGWTGKTWACETGVAATSAPIVLLLDADVRLSPGAVAALREEHRRRRGLLSVLPHHEPRRPHEQLSAPFNLVSVMGSGAAWPGADGRTTMAFGPCLVVERADLSRIGGFAAVAGEVAEDLALAARAVDAGLPVHALAGGALVRFRMYPRGVGELVEGWTKNVAAGASATDPVRAALVGLWVTAALAPSLSSLRRPRCGALLAATAAAVQLGVLARRVGSFRWWVAPAQPLLMAAFVAVFGRSSYQRHVRRRTTWKGRTIRS